MRCHCASSSAQGLDHGRIRSDGHHCIVSCTSRIGTSGVLMTSVMTLKDTSTLPGFVGSAVTDLTCNVARTDRPSVRVISVTPWRMRDTVGPGRGLIWKENGWAYPNVIASP